MKVFGWIISAVLAIVVAGFVFLYFSPDYNMRLVRSESMKPAINMGDMVITGPLGGPLGGEVKPGSVVTYLHGTELITHRVLSVDGDTLATKGDAVEDPDPWPVSLSEVESIYLFKIPYVGYIADFISTKLGWFLVIILPATALVALLVRDIFKELGRGEEKEVVRKKEVMPRRARDDWDY
jgi:signal peptidase